MWRPLTLPLLLPLAFGSRPNGGCWPQVGCSCCEAGSDRVFLVPLLPDASAVLVPEPASESFRPFFDFPNAVILVDTICIAVQRFDKKICMECWLNDAEK